MPISLVLLFKAGLSNPIPPSDRNYITMSHTYLKLQQSEGFVIDAAARIYSAYIQSGQLNQENKETLMKEAIRDALRIALTIDEAIVADEETG